MWSYYNNRIQLKNELNNFLEPGNYYHVFSSQKVEFDAHSFYAQHGINRFHYEYTLKNDVWYIVQLQKYENGDLHKQYIKPERVISEVQMDSMELLNCLKEALQVVTSKKSNTVIEPLGEECSNDSIDSYIKKSSLIAKRYDKVTYKYCDEVKLWGRPDGIGTSVDINKQRVIIDGICIENRILKYKYNTSPFILLIIFIIFLILIIGFFFFFFIYYKEIECKSNSNIKSTLERFKELGAPDANISSSSTKKEMEIATSFFPLKDIKDIEERIKSLREMSELFKCPMEGLESFYKNDVMSRYDGTYENFHYLPEAFRYMVNKAYEVAPKVALKPENTSYGILCDWLSDIMESERKKFIDNREVKCPYCHCSDIKLDMFNNEFECNSCKRRFGGI